MCFCWGDFTPLKYNPDRVQPTKMQDVNLRKTAVTVPPFRARAGRLPLCLGRGPPADAPPLNQRSACPRRLVAGSAGQPHGGGRRRLRRARRLTAAVGAERKSPHVEPERVKVGLRRTLSGVSFARFPPALATSIFIAETLLSCTNRKGEPLSVRVAEEECEDIEFSRTPTWNKLLRRMAKRPQLRPIPLSCRSLR